MSSIPQALDAPSYARGRLQLGIAGVGTMVLLAATVAGLGLPATIFPQAGGSFAEDLQALLGWSVGLALVTLPVEALGGFVVPRAFRRRHPSLLTWIIGWLRGALVVAALMSICGATVLAAARAAGPGAALGVFGVLLLALLLFQVAIARGVAGLRPSKAGIGAVEEELKSLGVSAKAVTVLEAEDEGFTGGIAGLPGRETCVLPVAWVGRFEPRALALLVDRRTRIIDGGLRAAGVALAVLWTLGTFAAATALPGAGLASVAGFVSTSLWFSLLSFLGLLLLPTPSRRGARAADARLVASLGDTDRALFAETLGALDRLQDDEPERSASVESIFHPIPSLVHRRRALGEPPRGIAPWHVARTAIYLSIAGMNPLHRLVHCNVGRPELWVFLPTDG
ncbi:hypothetical protein N9Z54_05205 [Planctomycetota bacterium]|jgi:hypothetical protein|nr:hypothetical protein [Planctomycetota bacterium]